LVDDRVALVVVAGADEPAEDARRVCRIRIRWIEDAGFVASAVDGRDVLARDGSPVDLAAGSIRPALDAREETLYAWTITMDREAGRADLVFVLATVRSEDGDQVLRAGENVHV